MITCQVTPKIESRVLSAQSKAFDRKEYKLGVGSKLMKKSMFQSEGILGKFVKIPLETIILWELTQYKGLLY